MAEMVVMAALVVWNRWSPGRLVLVMALAFTLVVTIVSLLNVDIFDFSRKAPWLWFVVYGGSVLVAVLSLWLMRNQAAVPAMPLPTRALGWMRIEAAALILYGFALLLLPVFASGFWPWPIDRFHAQAYSAVFLTGGAGALLLARGGPREELLVLGPAELAVGTLSILGLILTDAVVHRVVWSNLGTCAWIALFGLVAISGVYKIMVAVRHRSTT